MGAIGKIDYFGIILAMHISLLALDGVFDTGLATLHDAFSTANELSALQGFQAPPFTVSVVGVRQRVRTANGLRVPVAAAEKRPDWVIVPAIGAKMPDVLGPALDKPEVRDACALLQRWRSDGVRCAAACIGTFILAEAGVLDGEQATTTWWLAPWFRQRYPAVDLQDARILVPLDGLVTAGAALSHMDLALHLIRRVSPELADLTARYLIVDARPSQAAYMIADHLSYADPMVSQFERWARRRLDQGQGFALQEAADALHTSARTLARRMQETLGKSPLAYFQDLRVQYAVHLLKTTADSIDRIAERVGYADALSLRALLRKHYGAGVREIRGQSPRRV